MTLVSALDVANMSREDFVRTPVRYPCGCGENCGRTVNGEIPAQYTVGGRAVTEDCYFSIMSRHLDNHPINTPRDVE